MRLTAALAITAVTFAALASSFVQSSPVPHQASKGLRARTITSGGFNDWNCKPSSQHPLPVVLVHGLTGNAVDNWAFMTPHFLLHGYCVFALSYGQLNGAPLVYGLDKMENSAQQLSDYVDKVLAATGATQVDMLGHSEGSIMPQYYMKRLNGAAKINKFAAFGSIQYGTNLLGITLLGKLSGLYDPITKMIDPLCHSCLQLVEDSDFIKDLHRIGEPEPAPGVEYLLIVSRSDELVTPYTNGFFKGTYPNVRQVVLQDWCALDVSEHFAMVGDLPHQTAQGLRARTITSSGINDWECKPSKHHPRPVVLVHGLIANAVDNWAFMTPHFLRHGYCVFALNYGQLNGVPLIYGLDKMENSAQQLSDYVDKVLAATGATQVDMLGHSEGSIMPQYYMKRLNGAVKVNKFAAFGSVQYGTDNYGLNLLLQRMALYYPLLRMVYPLCRACVQVVEDSDFIKNLYRDGEPEPAPGVDYLLIVSRTEEFVRPYTNGFFKRSYPNVRQVVLQDWCPFDISGHIAMASDPLVFNGVHAFFSSSPVQEMSCFDMIPRFSDSVVPHPFGRAVDVIVGTDPLISRVSVSYVE
ncbi:hypothetical protein BGX28_007656 [Mortierella sp. GBA30]|nr:hypothetical protein BGX28_007656 [Mortierella sp. GBA30]